MARQVRHLKVKNGRFYARLAGPAAVKPILNRTELVVPLGADRREAMKQLPRAIAFLQDRISRAERIQKGDDPRSTITTQDYGRAVWERYTEALSEDETRRANMPDAATIAKEKDKIASGAIDGFSTEDLPLAALDLSLEYIVARDARKTDSAFRKMRLDALKREIANDETHQADADVDAYLSRNNLRATDAERKVLARKIVRADMEALQRNLERDAGVTTAGSRKTPLLSRLARLWRHRMLISVETCPGIRHNFH